LDLLLTPGKYELSARLFSQAEIVVAPHGAGLTNILFAENLIVIELLVHMLFQAFSLAKVLGFHYGCLASDHNQRNSTVKNLVV